MQRKDGRRPDEMRPVKITANYLAFAEGSALIEVGQTWVLCAASVEDRVPPFLRNTGNGWVTAEYSMLPRATSTRTEREVQRGRPAGRTAEIQRLIGRSLRGVIDTTLMGQRTITVDCDVIQADGGTRTAAITGAYVALRQAFAVLKAQGLVQGNPLTSQVAAVSAGVLDGVPVLDLPHAEDAAAEVDFNVVMTGAGRFIETQGTAEHGSYGRDEMSQLLDLADAGIRQLFVIQDKALEEIGVNPAD
ncbi:MAG: ribonuclease PH [Dehalococcoidia bacterium]|nr:ribonuclease PH [Dehalococcoidia bacterium]